MLCLKTIHNFCKFSCFSIDWGISYRYNAKITPTLCMIPRWFSNIECLFLGVLSTLHEHNQVGGAETWNGGCSIFILEDCVKNRTLGLRNWPLPILGVLENWISEQNVAMWNYLLAQLVRFCNWTFPQFLRLWWAKLKKKKKKEKKNQ